MNFFGYEIIIRKAKSKDEIIAECKRQQVEREEWRKKANLLRAQKLAEKNSKLIFRL